jgi:F0F1-type ATP synthase assembly protein I
MQGLRGIGRYGALGLDFTVSVVLGILAGLWLDKKFGLSPWFTIGGLCMGAAVGFNLMLKTAKQLTEELERAEREASERKAGQQEADSHDVDSRDVSTRDADSKSGNDQADGR